MNYVEATIWGMKKGYITELKYDDRVWIPKKDMCVVDTCISSSVHNSKKSYFIRYLKTKKPGDVFKLEDFFKDYPTHKHNSNYRSRLDKTISGLIQSGRIRMWVKPDEFKVLR